MKGSACETKVQKEREMTGRLWDQKKM